MRLGLAHLGHYTCGTFHVLVFVQYSTCYVGRRLVREGTPPVFVFFIVVALRRCESCRLGTAPDRRRGGQTVGSDQKKRFVVVLLAITHLTGKDGLC